MIDQSHKMDNKSKVRKGTAMFASSNEYDESYQKQ